MINRIRKLTGARSRTIDPAHVDGAIERAARTTRDAEPDTDRQWAALYRVLEAEQERKRASRVPLRKRHFAVAGGLALMAAAVVLVLMKGFDRPALVYQTGRGEIRSILLADSSEVTLNHSSTLTVRRNILERVRSVELEGEAFFAVRSTGKPFTVKTSVGMIQVMGTSFNVRERRGFLEVGVTEGAVTLTSIRTRGDSTVALIAGEFATCRTDGLPEAPRPLRFARYPGWMHGELQFHRTPLRSVLWEIEQRFDIQVAVEQPALFESTITGTLHGRDPYAVLSAVCALTGSDLRHEGDRYTLY